MLELGGAAMAGEVDPEAPARPARQLQDFAQRRVDLVLDRASHVLDDDRLDVADTAAVPLSHSNTSLAS